MIIKFINIPAIFFFWKGFEICYEIGSYSIVINQH